MKKLLLVSIFCIAVCFGCNAQQDNNWYRFTDTTSDLMGYKDANGNVKIQPKFTLLTNTHVFRNIMPVMEGGGNSKIRDYYLLKNGKKVGADSTYVFDFTFPCESEEKILFRDCKTDKVGFFDKNGYIVIPAMYNDAKPFCNNMAVVIRNGKRVCWDGKDLDPKNPCEHWLWQGTTSVIDAKGKILIDNIDYKDLDGLNWYSLKKANTPSDTSLYQNFKGTDGGNYAFVNYRKEFNKWFKGTFLNRSLSLNQLRATIFETVIRGAKDEEWQTITGNRINDAFLNTIDSVRDNINSGAVRADITSEHLNNFIFTGPEFNTFYNDCGEHNGDKHPVFEVLLSHRDKQSQSTDNQQNLTFILTDDGYRLISISL